MTYKDGLHFFPEKINDATILILGTFPSSEALKHGEYYKNNENLFWTTMSHVLECPNLCNESYTYKEQQLKQHGIILWDIIKSCEREGALDKYIIEESAIKNNLNDVLLGNNIKIVIINGIVIRSKKTKKLGAQGWFIKFNGEIRDFEKKNNVKVVAVHSTSPSAKKWYNLSEWIENIKPYIK